MEQLIAVLSCVSTVLIHSGETGLVCYVLYVYTFFFVVVVFFLFVCLFALYRIVTGMYGATACY